MSLVGTRPPTVDEWDKYELHHRARLATKPGLTGMWQVSGRSNITDFEEVVKLDKQYISEWTMGLDMPVPEQLAFTDVDGELVLFNEAEVLAALDEREKETTVKKRPVKKKGKREEDLSGIPVVKVEHYLTEKELEDLFGKAGWKQLPDEIYKRYRFIPAKVEVS